MTGMNGYSLGPYYQRQRCSPMTLDFGNIRFVRIFQGFHGEGALNDSGVIKSVDFQDFRTLVGLLSNCLNSVAAIRVRTIPVIGYRYCAVLASTAKYRYRVSVSSVSLAILLFGPSLIVRLSDISASTARLTARRFLTETRPMCVREGLGFAVLTADRLIDRSV